MISSYNSASQTIATDDLLGFAQDTILTGCTVTRKDGTFYLNKPGFYYVTFNAVGAATTTVGEVIVELQSDGVAVPGAIASFTPSAVEVNGNLAFATIVKVNPICCLSQNRQALTLVNAGVETLYSNVKINITKLC